MTLLKDLITIPEHLGKGDFVFSLDEAIDNPQLVLDNYVVTEQLQECFDNALEQIETSLSLTESRANYLHGSFGSGKSHFMAVLYLLLAQSTEAREVPELQSAVAKHDHWLEGKRFLLVPVHMINANVDRIEEAVLAAYVRRVEATDPGSPAPAVYRSVSLFENADDLREKMGDEKFFAELNAGAPDAPEGLGNLAGQRWNATSYEAAKGEKPGNPDHDALVSALVGTLLSAFRDVATGEQYVSLDDGLAVISRHAKDLGYDGLILFLDELILWLATRMADLDWVKQEGQKMATLRESARSERPAPITSFIARQRDLRELIGEQYPGAERSSFHDALNYAAGRFHTITLEDRNLNQIAEKRVLAPRNDDARRQIDEAFKQTVDSGSQVIDVLLGDNSSIEDFRRVYPFSPAFMETLVAASSALQRSRTAIRVMVQLLSDRRDEIELGDVIPVGDLFDVLRAADEPFSPELKQQFRDAQNLYESRLKPLVLNQAEDRLVKTLLLAALIAGSGALQALTAQRLVALNHGTIATPIPGEERSTALAALKRMRGSVGQLKIQEGADPTVSIELSGIDTDQIIASAAGDHDNQAARRRFVQEFIRGELGLGPADGLFSTYPVEWHGLEREVDLAIENVREITAERASAMGEKWRLVIDYPFDTEGQSRKDDEARIEELQDGLPESKTVFWLPAFFTHSVQQSLGKLVTINALLTGDRLTQHTANLSPTDRVNAKQLLESQRSQLESSLKEALLQAYGVASPQADVIEGQEKALFRALDESVAVKPPPKAEIREAVDAVIAQLLEIQYPASPEITDKVTAGKVSKVWKLVEEAAETSDGRLDNLDKPSRDLLRSIAMPLEIGTMHEGPFVLGSEWRERFTRAMAAGGVKEPTVREMRSWINDPDPRGLSADLERLIVLTYATRENMTFQLHGGPAPVSSPSDVSDELVLVQVPLPTDDEWELARARAAAIFGIDIPTLASAQNLTRYGATIKQAASGLREGVKDAKALINGTLNPQLGLDDQSERSSVTAETAALLEQLAADAVEDVVPSLAGTVLQATPEAIGRTAKNASSNAAAIRDAQMRLLSLLQTRAETSTRAAAAFEQVQKAAAASEIVESLNGALTAAEAAAVEILEEEKPSEVEKVPGVTKHPSLSVEGAKAVLDELKDPNAYTVNLTLIEQNASQDER